MYIKITVINTTVDFLFIQTAASSREAVLSMEIPFFLFCPYILLLNRWPFLKRRTTLCPPFCRQFLVMVTQGADFVVNAYGAFITTDRLIDRSIDQSRWT